MTSEKPNRFFPPGAFAWANSRAFTAALIALGFLFIGIVVFEAGMTVGFHRAQFAGHWGDNYARNFGGPARGGMPGADLPAGHGATGKIAGVTLPTFVIASAERPEETVRITDATVIRLGRDTVTADALKSGMTAVVIGSPNDAGEIEATLIRLMPPESASATPAHR